MFAHTNRFDRTRNAHSGDTPRHGLKFCTRICPKSAYFNREQPNRSNSLPAGTACACTTVSRENISHLYFYAARIKIRYHFGPAPNGRRNPMIIETRGRAFIGNKINTHWTWFVRCWEWRVWDETLSYRPIRISNYYFNSVIAFGNVVPSKTVGYVNRKLFFFNSFENNVHSVIENRCVIYDRSVLNVFWVGSKKSFIDRFKKGFLDRWIFLFFLLLTIQTSCFLTIESHSHCLKRLRSV